MIKYILGTLVALAAVLGAIFAVVAAANDRSEGPAPLIELRVTDATLTPDRVEVEAGQLAEFRLANDASEQRTLSTNTDKVEMLPVTSDVTDEHSANVPVPYVQIMAPPGEASSALVRFTEAGEYELRVQTAGRPETLQVAMVVVR